MENKTKPNPKTDNRKVWEGIALSSIIAFLCAIFIINYKVESSESIDFDIAIQKVILWLIFSALAGMSLYASKNESIKKIIKLTLIPSVILFFTLVFFFFASMVFHPIKSTVTTNETSNVMDAENSKKPVIYHEDGKYYALYYSPNASFAPIPYKVLIPDDDPIIKNAIIKTKLDSAENVYSKSKVIIISIIFFLLIALLMPIAMAFSHFAKSKIVSIVIWLSQEKSGTKLMNIEKNTSRIISLIAVLLTLIATLSQMR